MHCARNQADETKRVPDRAAEKVLETCRKVEGAIAAEAMAKLRKVAESCGKLRKVAEPNEIEETLRNESRKVAESCCKSLKCFERKALRQMNKTTD